MKKEVEILVEVLDTKEEALKKLAVLKSIGDKKTVDIYFFDPKREDLKPDKDGQLKNCLRVRNKDGESSIAYKIDHFDKKGIWLYSDEYESEVSDYLKIDDILKKLGLKELVRIENIKSTFVNDKYEVVLEEVTGLGLFMEVERHDIEDNEDIVNIKKEIWDWIQGLGIKIGLEQTMGKPELMLRKNKSLNK